jgi:spore coat polysaccharide biosynthesis predicted glycosyltransferase SpsG
VLLKFVEALDRLREPVRADILVGGSRAQALRERLAACAPHRVELHAADADAAALMAQADLALGAGGTTSWERCCLGLPALLVVLADNQRTVVAALAGAGAARSLGAASALDPARLAAELDAALGDPARLEAMSAAAAALCDGAGARRVANLLA